MTPELLHLDLLGHIRPLVPGGDCAWPWVPFLTELLEKSPKALCLWAGM